MYTVWEICKFWILQTREESGKSQSSFERYVNFEFYKQWRVDDFSFRLFERYVNFEFYKLESARAALTALFERYVNFEFYKRTSYGKWLTVRLRDM